ncbi:adrenocortical dysplasia protein homolog isoform X2 [Emydura macquarii macquarii]|uniref:adrenocortical dysplasia protein homolog isoform X2 n=1 Tax=Emydura macquarii macquarii TaxID=1129001 RepID=UPI00352AD04E
MPGAGSSRGAVNCGASGAGPGAAGPRAGSRCRGELAAASGSREQQQGQGESPLGLPERLEDEKMRFSTPKVYVLQPWILNLLMKYGPSDPQDFPMPGHVLKIVSDSKTADQGTAAVLHLSDGSYYIRVVVTTEAAKCAQLQYGFSSIIGKIIILQKYTVCFQEETKAEECEFYLVVRRFLVLPLQRQRMESLNCNQEPSILQKIKELWQRGLTLKTISSSGTSVSQLLSDMGQSRLKVLKQNVEECLDLLDPSDVPAIGEALPVSKWVAERKRETSKDVFTVSANFLVICPEEKAAIRDACLADPGAMSQSLDVSLDNPWDKLQSVSITLSSSLEEKSMIQPSLPSTQAAQLTKSAEEVVITQSDSNTPDFLESTSQKSPCSLSQDEPAEAVSPSLLSSHSVVCLPECACPGPEAAKFQMAPGVDKHPDASHNIPCGQPSAASHPNLCSFSPALPILGSINSRACHAAPSMNGGQADLNGMASLLNVGNSCLTSSKCDAELGNGAGGKDLPKSRKHMVTKRKLLMGGEEAHSKDLPNPGGAQRKPSHADVPTERAKKSRMEQAGLAQKPALPGHVVGLPGSGNETALATSWPAQHRAQEQKYVKATPFQYTYEAPTLDLCARVKSTRISKAMLRWACWVITKDEQLEL